MYRNAEVHLKSWYQTIQTRRPLLIRGARQVGKSTLVKQFCKNEGLPLVEINLEKKKLRSLLSSDINTIAILDEIDLTTNLNVHDGKAILFFDEIQAQPQALLALRYFFEEYPDIPIIAAGSLLEFTIEEAKFSIPVGRIEYLHLGPMTFGEFLMALGEIKLLKIFNDPEFKITEASHALFLSRLKQYFIVGGMPAAVKIFAEMRSLKNIRKIQSSILETYHDDFGKYATKNQVDKLRQIFYYVPRHLGEKVKFTEIDRDSKARDIKKCIDLLILARIIIPVYHTEATGLPLEGLADPSIFKLYFLDIGLTTALLQIKSEELIDHKLLGMFDGKLAEQFIAQHLYYQQDFSRPHLFYWLRDRGHQKAEVDFVLNKEGKVIPCEVKASKAGQLKSLHVFLSLKKSELAFKFDESLPAQVTQQTKIPIGGEIKILQWQLQSYPLYLCEKIK